MEGPARLTIPLGDQRTADVAALAWSGAAPLALAAAASVARAATSVHLVSPLAGPLVGPDALSDQTDRLKMIASTSPQSPWAGAPGVYAEFMALISSWPFALSDVRQSVTIWSPSEDEVVPPALVASLATRLRAAEVISVDGDHSWAIGNWHAVLQHMARAAR
jgi:hypothetical protein